MRGELSKQVLELIKECGKLSDEKIVKLHYQQSTSMFSITVFKKPWILKSKKSHIHPI